MIRMAAEDGKITEAEKKIILKKAADLGEDPDMVELAIEGILGELQTQASRKQEKGMTCPNCGAIISETTFKCPECGYVLQRETKASENARSMINQLQERLAGAAQSKLGDMLDIYAPAKRQASVLNGFTMPTTKEGLTQLLEFAYSNYISIGNGVQELSFGPLKNAWYGKTMQAYNTLARIGRDDPEIQSLLEKYSPLISQEKKKLSASKKFWIGWFIAAALFSVAMYFIFK